MNIGSARGSRTTEVNTSDSGSFRTPDVNSDIVMSVREPEVRTDDPEGGIRTSEVNTVNSRVSTSTEADV